MGPILSVNRSSILCKCIGRQFHFFFSLAADARSNIQTARVDEFLIGRIWAKPRFGVKEGMLNVKKTGRGAEGEQDSARFKEIRISRGDPEGYMMAAGGESRLTLGLRAASEARAAQI